MPRLRFLPAARAELIEIGEYIRNDSPVAAGRFVAKIEEACWRYAGMPGMGRLRPEIGPNVRSFPFGNYVVFYHQVPDGIEVLHVVHGARDIERLFRE